MFGLTKQELAVFKKLSSPIKIQDYLDRLPMNHEKKGETHMSPRRVLREKKAHCFEGALFAATALWVNGEAPLLMDLQSTGKEFEDDDHIVTLYKRNGYWGAISKTNHATIRFRDPVYKTLRELALSYFHEWFLSRDGIKTLRFFSKPLNLRRFGTDWITAEEELWHFDKALDALPHSPIVPKQNLKYVRLADRMERKAGAIIEWKE